jgi:hypothetical protein
MTGDEANLDSFVDIVTNTAGILVVLVVLSVMRSHEVGTRFNPKLAKLAGLREGLTKQKTSLTQIKTRIERARSDVASAEAEFARSLAAIGASGTDIGRFADGAARAEALTQAQQENAQRAIRLTGLKAEETSLDEEATRAREQARPALVTLAPETGAYVLKTSLKDIQGELATLEGTSASIAGECTRLGENKSAADETVAQRRKDLAIWNVQKPDVRGLSPARTGAARHFIECHVPSRAGTEEKTAFVRMLAAGAFERTAEGLKATQPGESIRDVLDTDSEYRTFLARYDEAHRAKHVVHFLVRPDAYDAFRVARALAWEAGWEVAWTPIEAGEGMSFGR